MVNDLTLQELESISGGSAAYDYGRATGRWVGTAVRAFVFTYFFCSLI